MAKKVDVLKKKQSELNTYLGQASAAISLVTDTVATLGIINEQIGEKIQEIDEYTAGLAYTRSGLEDAKHKNECIIKNFNALLSGN